MGRNKNRLWARGYTLMEIVAVIIILGILAALAIPSYWIQTRKVQNQEAVGILAAIYTAQIDYARENDDGNDLTRDFANDIDDLDVEVDEGSIKNFYNLEVSRNRRVSCSAFNDFYLASLTTRDDSYTLYILQDGRIVCTPCDSSLCLKMGF